MIRFLTAGESHGPELTAIVEGFPAGLPMELGIINHDLKRRQKSEGSGGRMSIETDIVRFTAGVMNKLTTGGPICMVITNRDFASWRNRDISPMTIPRPGHADLNAAIKYGYHDLRLGLERSSARETAARVSVGALCRSLLSYFGIAVGSYVISIGNIEARLSDDFEFPNLMKVAEENPVRCPDYTAAQDMIGLIDRSRSSGETLGGVFEVMAVNVPPGLGSHVHWDRRISGRLMGAVGSIQAIKGVEIGNAFDNCRNLGSAVHDVLTTNESGILCRETNRSGGVEGGITSGTPIVVRAAMKPISTLLKGMDSVNLSTGETARTIYERSDICAVPRAAVVAEAMVCYVLADELMRKLGGDSVSEMRPRFEALRSAKISEVPMNNEPWRFGYE